MVLSPYCMPKLKNESANNITAASTESVTETSVTSDTEKKHNRKRTDSKSIY